MMWFLLLVFIAHCEPFVTRGTLTSVILANGGSPCEGQVLIYHDNKWGYVGDTYWNRSTEEVVCLTTHCGTPESTGYGLIPDKSTVWLDEIECNGKESHLLDCEYPGWEKSFSPKDTTRMIKCSSDIQISLDGFQCAGAAKYSIDGGMKSGYFCGDNWKQDEADLLCKSLKCGKSKEHKTEGWMDWEEFKNSEKMAIKCLDTKSLDNLWQCVTQPEPCLRPIFVTCTGHERLRLKGDTRNVCQGQPEIEENGSWRRVENSTKLKSSSNEWCQQMNCGNASHLANHTGNDGIQLTCTDNVVVNLTNNITKCYGEVQITVNGESHSVCGSSWSKENGEVVCRELNCGNVIESKTLGGGSSIIDSVKCIGNETSLWHCKAKGHSKSRKLTCSSRAYVVCADSVDVVLVDGLGKCAGRLEILYEGTQKRVHRAGWENENKLNNLQSVCKQMDCGDDGTDGSFSKGSAAFLNKAIDCPSKSSKISECFKEGNSRGQESVGIICNAHKVVFLEGDHICAGMVGIEDNSQTYWLSGSNETWNLESANAVCRQRHCGEAIEYTSVNLTTDADKIKNIWDEPHSCSSNTTSLFECKKNMTLPSDYKKSIASVICNGKPSMHLTKESWGNVNICVGEKCGGVCDDTWTNRMSQWLCAILGYEDKIMSGYSSPEVEVLYKSVHSTRNARNLNQISLVSNNKGRITCNPATVICSGGAQPELELYSTYSCSGNLVMQYPHWSVPVCKKALEDRNTQNLICGALNCGQSLRLIDHFGPKTVGTDVISSINCNDKTSLKACDFSSDKSKCDLGALQCSGWSKTELKLGEACSGAVFVHSEGDTSAVGIEGWTEDRRENLCKGLGCGSFKPYTNTTVNYLSGKQHFIECHDEPKVNLCRGDSCHDKNCRGEVMINNINVCNTTWKEEYSHLVCKELGCSKAITQDYERKPHSDMEYYHVSCEHYHHKLGQCSRFRGKCDGGLVSVYCVGNVEFTTTKTCGGWIKVKYRNRWDYLCPITPLSPKFKDELCEKLGCKGHNDSLIPIKRTKLETRRTTKLDCTGVHTGINHCIKYGDCKTDAADIYCNGYVEEPTDNDKGKGRLPVPAILGIVFFLVLAIIIAVIVRVRMSRRAKKPDNFPSRMMPGGDEEFESGEYDNVTSKEDEIEDFSPGSFRSEAKVVTKNDVRSTSSLSYDDIDEKAETLPLTSEAATHLASGDKNVHEGAIPQSLDEVNYEVEDPQESYDDIDASPVIAHTKAEVHERPQDTTEGTAPGPVRGDEDYLVPGHDG